MCISASQRIKRERGFTLLELLITFVLVGIITTLSVPSMKSVTKRHDALESATRLAQHINLARDQAIRRNRAYEVIVNEMGSNAPQGVLLISEAPANSCQSIIDQPDQVSALEVSVYGGSQVPNLSASSQPAVGVAGWRLGHEGNYQSERIQLCFNTRGALFRREGGLYTEVGRLQLGVQQFQGPPWIALGRAQEVNLNFSSGAQVQR
jgi:prepilin-type N-terminal cleavage/methylation domain-containing protein